MAMWSLLGAKGIDILAWDSFGRDWVTDVIDQLQIKNTKLIDVASGTGDIPKLFLKKINQDAFKKVEIIPNFFHDTFVYTILIYKMLHAHHHLYHDNNDKMTLPLFFFLLYYQL